MKAELSWRFRPVPCLFRSLEGQSSCTFEWLSVLSPWQLLLSTRSDGLPFVGAKSCWRRGVLADQQRTARIGSFPAWEQHFVLRQFALAPGRYERGRPHRVCQTWCLVSTESRHRRPDRMIKTCGDETARVSYHLLRRDLHKLRLDLRREIARASIMWVCHVRQV